MKKLLLLFLGGIPSSPHIIQHWIEMNTEFNNKEYVYIAIHPLQLPLEESKEMEDFTSVFKSENVFVVDKDHHVPTLWGTRSLVDATLLMMQYGHLQIGEMFDKYILLSSTCCPLYRMDEIYTDVFRDDKSIMALRNDGREIGQSQWMVLDKRHASVFFYNNSKTYTISEKYPETCTRVKDQSKQLYSLLIDEKMPVNYVVLYRNYLTCNIADEMFFIKILMELVIKDKSSIKDHLRTLSVEKVKQNILNRDDSFYNELIRITKQNERYVKHLDPVYVGNVSDYISIYSYKDIKFTVTKEYLDSIQTSSVIGITVSTVYNPLNVLRDFKLLNKFDSNTFINQMEDPMTVKRKIDYEIYSCETLKKTVNPDNPRTPNLFNVRPLVMMTTVGHPSEYGQYTVNHILNTFILLHQVFCLFLNNTHRDQHKYYAIRSIYVVYLCILVNEFKLTGYDDIINDFYKGHAKITFYFDPVFLRINKTIIFDLQLKYSSLFSKGYLFPLLQKRYGTVLTADIIGSALCNQSYFIRKCYDSSLIETFSSVLKTIDIIQGNNIIEFPLPSKPILGFELPESLKPIKKELVNLEDLEDLEDLYDLGQELGKKKKSGKKKSGKKKSGKKKSGKKKKII
jgi:hypothetical protein